MLFLYLILLILISATTASSSTHEVMRMVPVGACDDKTENQVDLEARVETNQDRTGLIVNIVYHFLEPKALKKSDRISLIATIGGSFHLVFYQGQLCALLDCEVDCGLFHQHIAYPSALTPDQNIALRVYAGEKVKFCYNYRMTSEKHFFRPRFNCNSKPPIERTHMIVQERKFEFEGLDNYGVYEDRNSEKFDDFDNGDWPLWAEESWAEESDGDSEGTDHWAWNEATLTWLWVGK